MKKLLLPFFLGLAIVGCKETLDLTGANFGDDQKTVAITVSNVPDEVIGEELYLYTQINGKLYAAFQSTAFEEDTTFMLAPPPGLNAYDVIAFIPTGDDWTPEDGFISGWYSIASGIKDRSTTVLIKTWTNAEELDISNGGANKAIELELVLPEGDNEYNAGYVLPISANVTNNQVVGVTISTVEFSVDGTVVETMDTAPYEFNYNTVGLEPGIHQVSVVATNSIGQSVDDKSQFTILLIENEAPCVEITYPANNTKIVHGTTSFNINARAGDDDEIIKVEFIIGGQVVETKEGDDLVAAMEALLAPSAVLLEAASCSGTTYSYTWNTYENSVGAYEIQVRVTDSENVMRTDVINVELTQPDNYTPYIEITSPSNVDGEEFPSYTIGETLSISTLNYDLDNEIDSVLFYVGGVYAGVDKTSDYSVTYILNQSAGTKSVQARAYYSDENDNVFSVSDNVNINLTSVAP